MGLLSSFLDRREVRGAERRWTAFNAAADADPKCICGQRGTARITSNGQVGNVPPVFWMCDEHKSVPLTTPFGGDGRPLVEVTPNSWHPQTGCGCGQDHSALA